MNGRLTSFRGLVAIAAAVAYVAISVCPASAKIRIRSAVQIGSSLVWEDRAIAVSMSVRDDIGAGAPQTAVELHFLREDGTPAPLRSIAPCIVDTRASPLLPGRSVAHDAPLGIVAARTDSAGLLCLRVEPFESPARAQIVVPATDAYLGATAEDRVRRPPPFTLVLAREDVPMFVDEENAVAAMLTPKGSKGGAPRASVLELVAPDGSARVIARGDLDGEGEVKFTVAAGLLGDPGTALLRARFEGDRAAHDPPAPKRFHTLAHVTLALASPPWFERAASGGAEEATILVAVRSRSGVKVPSGTVVVLRGDAPLGAAEVRDGQARIPVRIDPHDDPGAALSMRYEPAAPWFVPDGPISIEVRRREPWWQNLALLVSGALVLALAVVGRFVYTNAGRADTRSSASMKVPMAKLDRVADTADDATWRGVVQDAHDGVAIPGVAVRFVRGGFTGTAIVAETLTGSDGTFVLTPDSVKPGDRITLTCTSHEPLERDAPRPGLLRIELVSRRRALLGRLVAWARARGLPRDVHGGEPTPLQVAREVGEDSPEGRWAADVHRVAFGPATLGDAAATIVDDLPPKSSGGGPRR